MSASDKKNMIVNSALWAAYGDALGFITELADKKILKARIKKDRVDALECWTRKIGGMYGPSVDFPSGAYSDDTQLRLATSRSINKDGHFSVQSFSKIEMPVWQSYALGAGRGSKLAAANLAKKSTAWFGNFYKDSNTNYVNAGGNGGVMRIQPHIWSAKNTNDPNSYLLDVIKNTLSTHGHPRAIAGSVFHALTLASTINNRKIPQCKDFHDFNQWTLKIPEIIRRDINLNTAWISVFENAFGKSIEDAYQDVFDELNMLIESTINWSHGRASYSSLVKVLDLKNPLIRGSGTQTAIAASAASTLFGKMSLEELIIDISNELGTDTDSIATMVGAIVGLVTDIAPPQHIQDQDYITLDAQRLCSISQSQVEDILNYSYPNPLSWRSPSSALDYVSKSDNKLLFEPFGIVTVKSKPLLVIILINIIMYINGFNQVLDSLFLLKCGQKKLY
ncbi:ADP-ribosylglycohydrolase family protein [Photobacterium damselae subsp. damselae]|uniref:ADP-ribosylglycohydrolase family protein n=1 Tax=Photobacterium damselae TaxID=38293 RepID=UPI001F3139F7|nr:ADP-ribosylglycohydrolase family protein [Photobacterium damselae]UKA26673.1 ADP-ribosylglycohydrolase family protein [Photobacterium damselae subsp. damselae]